MLELDSSMIPVMGVSDSELFLSEKDLALEFNFIAAAATTPLSEYADQVLRHQEHKAEEEEEEEDFSVELRKLLSGGDSNAAAAAAGVKGDDEEDSDGFKTPTSLDHRLPVIPRCPPAPRKSKTLSSSKRKATSGRGIFLDLSEEEFDSAFPPPPAAAAMKILWDLGSDYGVKKSKK